MVLPPKPKLKVNMVTSQHALSVGDAAGLMARQAGWPIQKWKLTLQDAPRRHPYQTSQKRETAGETGRHTNTSAANPVTWTLLMLDWQAKELRF